MNPGFLLLGIYTYRYISKKEKHPYQPSSCCSVYLQCKLFTGKRGLNAALPWEKRKICRRPLY
jgi:hypothetical protein